MRLSKDNWTVLGIMLVMVAVFVTVIYLPQSRKLDAVRHQIAQAEQRLDQERQKAACVPDAIRDVQKLKRQLQDFHRRLPKQKEMGEFLETISSTLIAGRLVSESIRPGDPTPGPLYNRLPIIMEFAGTFDGLADLLGKLDSMERLTRIESIEIRLEKPESEKLQVKLQLNVYSTES